MQTIQLREATVEDLPVLHSFQLDDDAAYMAAFMSDNWRDAQAYIEKWTRFFNDPGISLRIVLCDGKIAGCVGKWMLGDEAQITYWIDRAFWGKGVASRAVGLFLETETIRPIFGRTAFDNVGSQRVLEKNNFVRVGTDSGFANARQTEVEEYVFRLS